MRPGETEQPLTAQRNQEQDTGVERSDCRWDAKIPRAAFTCQTGVVEGDNTQSTEHGTLRGTGQRCSASGGLRPEQRGFVRGKAISVTSQRKLGSVWYFEYSFTQGCQTQRGGSRLCVSPQCSAPVGDAGAPSHS